MAPMSHEKMIEICQCHYANLIHVYLTMHQDVCHLNVFMLIMWAGKAVLSATANLLSTSHHSVHVSVASFSLHPLPHIHHFSGRKSHTRAQATRTITTLTCHEPESDRAPVTNMFYSHEGICCTPTPSGTHDRIH
jgi:hypothetical protein